MSNNYGTLNVTVIGSKIELPDEPEMEAPEALDEEVKERSDG